MKKFLDVEKNRTEYHRDPYSNTVHRASLLVPRIEGYDVDISFLNHFLIKRGYKEIGCRITALNLAGNLIQSHLTTVNEPRVYTIQLTDLCDKSASAFIIEFYCSNNLFIPFPAVMINHRSERTLNVVHAYNRTLNDVFEEDAINSVCQMEGGIDVEITPAITTFLIFSAGQFECKGELNLKLIANGAEFQRIVSINVSRFGHFEIRLNELFSEVEFCKHGILLVSQPKQTLFFGRLLVGKKRISGAGFSANHSYYYLSSHREYWPNNIGSFRQYPFLRGLINKVRFYPIMSLGRLRIELVLRDCGGQPVLTNLLGLLDSPGNNFIETNINEICASANLNSEIVSSFTVYAHPIGGETPTRINHQLVYSSGGLETSINMSLLSPNVFEPQGKRGFVWGQIAVGIDYSSFLGVTSNSPDGADFRVSVEYYSQDGCFSSDSIELKAGAAYVLNLGDKLSDLAHFKLDSKPTYIWYCLRSDRSDIYAYSVTRELLSGDCTGEHAF
jgi:hypothetical protein